MKKSLILLVLLLVAPLHVFANAPEKLTGQVHIEDLGWQDEVDVHDGTILGTTGKHKKLEGVILSTKNPNAYALSVESHVEDIGWQDAVTNSLSGTTGKNKGIEAIVINSSGELADQYDLYYRVHVENYGWTNWAKSGEPAGTTGLNLQAEALQIRILDSGKKPTAGGNDVSWSVKSKSDEDFKSLFKVSRTFPHDTSKWTEGLSFYKNRMYESTGKYGESKIFKDIEFSTNEAKTEKPLDSSLYGEGSTVLNDKLYLLTYKEHKVLVYDPETLELIETFNYPAREGWGLTNDGENLIASDGSSHLYFMDESLKNVKTLTVKYEGQEIDNLNELEYVDGRILANVWYSDTVLVINPQTGEVTKRIDFKDFYNGPGDVFNGIAYNPDSHKIYFTGKLWSQMFECEMSPYAVY